MGGAQTAHQQGKDEQNTMGARGRTSVQQLGDKLQVKPDLAQVSRCDTYPAMYRALGQ